MTEQEHGYKAWVRAYKESRRANEAALQREADEYVRMYLKSKRFMAEEDEVPEVDEEGFVVVKGPRRARGLTPEEIDPILAETSAIRRKRRRRSAPLQVPEAPSATPQSRKFYRMLAKHRRTEK